jgi:Ca2+-binding EF-hand superfamily protein
MDATEREQAFEEVDKDNSGAVDRSEFLLWWERIIKTHDEAQMELVRAEVQAEQAVARQASEMSANGMEEPPPPWPQPQRPSRGNTRT